MSKRNPQHSVSYGPEGLARLFTEHGLTLSKAQAQQFWVFHTLLRRYNEELDLTRLHAFETIVLKHYIDCALVARLLRLPSPLLDMGTGPGFPGIPLKLIQPNLTLLLSEPRKKRVAFLREAISALGLHGVRIIPHKITPRFTEPVAGVICRALGSIDSILGAVRGCLIQGGLVIFMKGPRVDEEIAELPENKDFVLHTLKRYRLGKTEHRRTLVVFRRVSPMRPVSIIESKQNKRFKRFRSLLTSRGIRKEGCALFAGRKIVPEVIARFNDRIESCLVRASSECPEDIPGHVPVYAFPAALFSELDPAGTGGPILVVKVPREFPPWKPQETTAEVTLLLGLQDPANLGAALRAARAFGVTHVVLLKEAAHPFLPKSLRASGPAALQVRFFQGPPMAEIPREELTVVALSPEGCKLPSFRFPERFCLLVGTEGQGIPPELEGVQRVAIPQSPAVESLNAVTALAVALYAYRLGRPLRPETS